MLNSQEVKIFVISLDRALERRSHMRRLLAGLGLEAEFVSAIDGRTLSHAQRRCYDSMRSRQVYGCDMTDSEIGCYLSHLKVYAAMIARDIEIALVLEDDVACSGDIGQVLEDAATAAHGPWSVLRLHSTKQEVAEPASRKFFGQAVGTLAGREICRIESGVLGGCGYIIRKSAARTLLRGGERIFMPIDQTLDRYWENGIVPYVVRPLPVWHPDVFASEIGERGRHIAGAPSFRQIAVRRLQRMADAVNKRIFWLGFKIPLLALGLSHCGVRSAEMALCAALGVPALKA